MAKEKIQLEDVQETLLLPLWGRAVETKKAHPLLTDNTAVNIVKSIDYDFSHIAENINELSRLAWIARSLYFDRKIQDFLAKNPNGTVINVGCGFDTTFDRIDNHQVEWYDLDVENVIALRKKFIKETEQRFFLPYSVFDKAWYQHIKNKKNVLIMMAGVIYYFNETEVKGLFQDFSDHFMNCEAMFDYSSPLGVKVANKKVIDDGGMDKSAYLSWGIKNIKDICKWDPQIRILENRSMFKGFKRKLGFQAKIGTLISDKLEIMSLTHIKLR
jgi:O-methyltransferase involved in polyketide biosynthesis